MVTTGPGIAQQNQARFSRLRMKKEVFLPFAANTTYAVNNQSVAAAEPGLALTLTTAGAAILPAPDFVTFGVTDASGTNLSVTIELVGYRRGVLQRETLTATGTATSATSTKVYDQIESATITAIANEATNDTARLGIAGTRLGLWHGIEKVGDVKRILKRASAGTPTLTVVDADSVDLTNEAIKITAAAGDLYVVEYLATTKRDGFSPRGALS
jgi:hypothetical protein